MMTAVTMASVATNQLGQSDCGLAHIQERIKKLQNQVEQITMMTERKKVVLEALRTAVAHFGYNLDAVMASKSRERNLVDIRSIVWTIYKNELGCSCMQMAPDFNWDRCTIYYCIKRSEGLRDYDRSFADMFDSLYVAYKNAFVTIQHENSNITTN